MSTNSPSSTSNLPDGVAVTQSRVAVDLDYYWQPMETCPRGVKVQLLGIGGVAVYGTYDGKNKDWQGWAPLPKRRSGG